MNIFVVWWTEFLLVLLGTTVLVVGSARGASGLEPEIVTEKFNRELFPFSLPRTIRLVCNGLELGSRVVEPMRTETTSRRIRTRNLQEQNWKAATGGIEEESSGNHGQNVMFIHNDRRWTRSATTEYIEERPSETGKSKKSSHTLSSRKDSKEEIADQVYQGKKQEFPRKRHLHLLFQDKHHVIMSHAGVPIVAIPRNEGIRSRLESSSVHHPQTNARQSEVSSGAVQKHIKQNTKLLKVPPNPSKVLEVFGIAKEHEDSHSIEQTSDGTTSNNVQPHLRHVWEMTTTSDDGIEERNPLRYSRRIPLMPHKSSFIHKKDTYLEIFNKFPVLENFRWRSRGKRNENDRHSFSTEWSKSKKLDAFKVDEERVMKNYSWDSSSSGDEFNPLGSEWEVDERDYGIHQQETNELMNTTDGTYLASGDVLKKSRDELVIIFITTHPVELWKSLGIYDNSFLDSVHTHWLQFKPASPTTFEILRGIYCFIMVCGVGGNFLVILMFIRCRSLRTPPNYLIVNLAASDGLMMLKMPIFIFNASYGGPALGSIGCKIYGYVGGLSGTASIMTLAAIALERFTVIAYPLNPLKRTTSSKALWIVLAIWVYSIFFSTLPFFGVSGYVAEGYLTSCSFDYLSTNTSDRVFVFIFFLAAFVFPFCIIVFSYVKIFRTVRSAEKLDVFNPKDNGEGSGNRESFRCKHRNKKQKTELKIAILSCTIILVWLVAWTPYSVISLMGIFGYKDLITPLWSAIPSLFCKTAGCIDPFLYAIKHPRFQRELRAKLPLLVCGVRVRRSESYTTRSSEASYYSTNTLSRTLTSCRRQTSLSTTAYCDEATSTTTMRKQSEGASLVNSSPHLTFDLREMSSLNSSPSNLLHPGTKKRLKSSLKRNARRKPELIPSSSSDENDKACATKTPNNSTSCPIPDETIHLLCRDDDDEHLNCTQKYSNSEYESSNRDEVALRSFGNEKREGFNSNFDDEVNNSRMNFSRDDGTNGERKTKSCLEKVEVQKITECNKVEIDHDDEDHDPMHNVVFKGQINRTKLARSKSATLSSNNKVRESGGESVQSCSYSKDTLVVRTERKRAGIFPHITYETTIL